MHLVLRVFCLFLLQVVLDCFTELTLLVTYKCSVRDWFMHSLQVYKSFPYHPTNNSFDPQLSLSAQDVAFLKDSGFSVVRLYVAWPGVEPSKGVYNDTYLDVRVNYLI